MLQSEIKQFERVVSARKRANNGIKIFDAKEMLVFTSIFLFSMSFVGLLDIKQGSFWYAFAAMNGCGAYVATTAFKTIKSDTALVSKVYGLLCFLASIVGILGLAHYSF